MPFFLTVPLFERERWAERVQLDADPFAHNMQGLMLVGPPGCGKTMLIQARCHRRGNKQEVTAHSNSQKAPRPDTRNSFNRKLGRATQPLRNQENNNTVGASRKLSFVLGFLRGG